MNRLRIVGVVSANRVVGLCLAFAISVAGCKSKDDLPPSRATSSASAASTASASARRIVRDDCSKWAAHGAEVFVSAFEDATKNCTEDIKKNIKEKVTGQRVSVREGAKMVCSKHIDEVFQTQDADCFMRAKTGMELVGCKFGPMTNPEDSDWVSMVEDLRKQCSPLPAPKAPATSL